METIFGIEINSIMVVVLALFFVCLASVAFMAVRNPLVFKLGVRSVPRRRGQTLIIVVGLMLSTLIISAAFATGDTVTNTIRQSALKDVGNIDETIKIGQSEDGASEHANAPAYFPIAAYDKVRRDTQNFNRIDGVLPVISEAAPAVDKTSRQTTPTLFIKAFNTTDAKAFGELTNKSGSNVSTEQLTAAELYLNESAAKDFNAQPGDEIQLYVGQQPATFKVRDIVKDGNLGDAGATAVMSLSRAQALFSQPGKINIIWVSNQGGVEDGAQYTSEVVEKLKTSVAGTDLGVTPVKQDALKSAEAAGSSFASIFTIFGLFSIMAGVLLIFLIFVMLAAERKSEMGMARAVGIQRGDLIRMFLFEGTFYDLAAALVGVAMGLVVSFVMVLLMGSFFAGEGLEIAYRFTARTVLVSYGLGMLITSLV
ncbi:MAG: ABC transporter permease, partial [Chloroflexi bacterium]|nr:ABC transporter permease [Chloroflexota bacterium]